MASSFWGHKMRDEDKTKDQLISELEALRQRIAELEALKIECKLAEEALRGSEKEVLNGQKGIVRNSPSFRKISKADGPTSCSLDEDRTEL